MTLNPLKISQYFQLDTCWRRCWVADILIMAVWYVQNDISCQILFQTKIAKKYKIGCITTPYISLFSMTNEDSMTYSSANKPLAFLAGNRSVGLSAECLLPARMGHFWFSYLPRLWRHLSVSGKTITCMSAGNHDVPRVPITLRPAWGYDPLQPGDPRGSQRGTIPLFRQRITIDFIV